MEYNDRIQSLFDLIFNRNQQYRYLRNQIHSDWDYIIGNLKTEPREINPAGFDNNIASQSFLQQLLSQTNSEYIPANTDNKPSKERLDVIEDIFNPPAQRIWSEFYNDVHTNQLKNNVLDQYNINSTDVQWSKIRTRPQLRRIGKRRSKNKSYSTINQ